MKFDGRLKRLTEWETASITINHASVVIYHAWVFESGIFYFLALFFNLTYN